MKFNEKLLKLRKEKGLSQEELGMEMQVSRQTVSKWEAGQSYPDFTRLVMLSDFFDMTLDELVKDIDVQEVRENSFTNEKIDSIYRVSQDVNSKRDKVVYSGQFYISMLSYSSFLYTAVYLSRIQCILAYLLIANYYIEQAEDIRHLLEEKESYSLYIEKEPLFCGGLIGVL